MNGFRRRLVARIGLGALLFLQLAVSVYACAMPSLGSAGTLPIVADAAHASCEGSGVEPSKLCEQHCLQSALSVDVQPHSAPAVPALPPIRVAVSLDTPLHAACEAQHARRVVAVDPPPLERFGVLRI